MGSVFQIKVPEPYARNPDRQEFETMSAGVTVAGMVSDGMGGLRESQSAFRKHHQEVGAALLNISGVDTVTGGPVDKDEPRPTYHKVHWPKMIYHPDGREVVVEDDEDRQKHFKHGFRDEPYPKPKVAVNDPATEKKALMDTNSQLQSQITQQNDLMQRMAARLEQLENAELPKIPAKADTKTDVKK